MSTSLPTSNFRALRAWRRGDHLHQIRDEIANALTHGLGAAAALAGGAVLITLAALFGNGWQLGAAIVFGVALLLLYVASTLYHAIQHPVLKGRLQVFDALTFKFRELKIRKDPKCPICGENRTIHELIDYNQFCGIDHQL